MRKLFAMIVVSGVSAIVIGSHAATYDGAMAKADKLAELAGLGETVVTKLFRPPKKLWRLTPVDCPVEQRDIIGEDGSIVGCDRRPG